MQNSYCKTFRRSLNNIKDTICNYFVYIRLDTSGEHCSTTYGFYCIPYFYGIHKIANLCRTIIVSLIDSSTVSGFKVGSSHAAGQRIFSCLLCTTSSWDVLEICLLISCWCIHYLAHFECSSFFKTRLEVLNLLQQKESRTKKEALRETNTR